jgi:hypothetical protein
MSITTSGPPRDVVIGDMNGPLMYWGPSPEQRTLGPHFRCICGSGSVNLRTRPAAERKAAA